MKLLFEIGLTILLLLAGLGVALLFQIVTDTGTELVGELGMIVILLGVLFVIFFYIVRKTDLVGLIKELRNE